ncbi:response regulator [Vreelandella olivaria]|uniref:response regulator n=1 Tax=Vreelandella olivaria TaxID=390919 RepID=UPI00201EE019|nr:response regulator [Halomonas olivaria]
MQFYQREHFWNAIVWPVLWPLLLVQAALVILCIFVGLVIWGMSPNQVSWSTTLWLAFTLLLGSCMNVGVFLMLVKARAKYKDALFLQELAELERHSETLYFEMVGTDIQSTAPVAKQHTLPLRRLSHVNDLLAELVRIHANTPFFPPSSERSKQDQALLEDLHHQQKQLKHLIAGRDRAREESRLKSGYLTLLQREADSLFDHVGGMLKEGASKECRQNVTHVRERLADIRALLANFVQQSVNESSSFEALLPPAKRQLKVLVVDDGPVNLMLARQMLESQGLQVEGVSSGEQALERQQTTFFDLVFMDIFMPTLDGLETTRRWRDFESTTNSQRSIIIALTANVDNAGRDTCEAAGLNDVLAKPYQPETLIGMITKWMPNVNNETSIS